MNAQNGDLTTANTINSAAATSLTSGTGDITVGAAINGNQGITLTANGSGGDITLNGTLNARNTSNQGQIVTLLANRNVTINGGNDIWADGRATNAHGGVVNITATNGTFSMMGGTGSQIITSGQSDATHNRINITANDMNMNSRLYTRGDNFGSAGSAGGNINLVSTGGDITLNSGTDFYTQGYAESILNPGNGGNINITAAGNYHQNGGQFWTNVVASSNQGLGGANHAGNVTINSGGSQTFTRYGGTLITGTGASYGSGSFDGGDGGIVTLNSGSTIAFVNAGGGNNPLYFDLNGGNGRGSGKFGGSGGNVHLNAPGSITMQGLNASQPYRNLDIRAGSGGGGASSGTQGHIYVNGGVYY